MDHNWNYDGRLYTFDISDAECLERMGRVFSSVREGLDGDEDKLTPAEKAVRTCDTVRGFFTALFGEEASLAICGDRQSAVRCTEAYFDFIAFLNAQINEFSHIREAIETKYAARAASLADPARL